MGTNDELQIEFLCSSENRTTDILESREVQVVVSTLVVERATPKHAGNYSCVVPEKAKITVAVHVLNGESPMPFFIIRTSLELPL